MSDLEQKRFWSAAAISGLALAAMSSAPASATFVDGDDLHSYCESHEQLAVGYTMAIADEYGVVQSVIDEAGNPVRPRRFICIPNEVNANQVKDVACRYLSDNPEELHYPAPFLVYNALLDAWPCAGVQ